MRVVLTKDAQRALMRSNKRVLLRRKIDELAKDPLSLSANVKKLEERPNYRLRVQDWRIIFRLEDDTLWIDEVAPRGSAYEVKR